MTTTDNNETDGVSVSEQIERTSVNIITFSALSEESGMPLNIPNILGGEDIIKDDVSKLKVEEAFGQLNIQSLFGFEEHMFQSCLYDTFHVDTAESGDEDEKLTPHLYLLKSHTNDIYLLNLLATPYADLNLDAYFNEVEFMSRSFSGVFRRTNAQIDDGLIDEEEQIDIAKETVGTLSGFMHFQIFAERGLRKQVSEMFRKGTAMVLGMFIELEVDHSEYQCLGDCGKTFSTDDSMFGDIDDRTTCPECSGNLIQSPPILKMENIRYIVPKGGSDHLKELGSVHDSPRKYLSYLTGITMPRNIALTTNRLSPDHFSTLAAIPSKAAFTSPTDKEEYINLGVNWRRQDGKVFMFCSVGNSKFAGRNELPFIPQITSATINRQIVEGFEKGKSLEQIVNSSIISDWVLSDSMNINEVGQFQSLSELPGASNSSQVSTIAGKPQSTEDVETSPQSSEIGEDDTDVGSDQNDRDKDQQMPEATEGEISTSEETDSISVSTADSSRHGYMETDTRPSESATSERETSDQTVPEADPTPIPDPVPDEMTDSKVASAPVSNLETTEPMAEPMSHDTHEPVSTTTDVAATSKNTDHEPERDEETEGGN